MGHLCFYLAVVAACLLWSAAFTAAAARSRPGWGRLLLVAAALVVPPLALAPWLAVTGWLAALGFQTNWFAATVTTMLSAVIGAAWIVRAGLAPRSAPAAAAWPLVGLAAMFVLAKAVAAGTLLFIDNAVAAEGRMLRVEAAQMMTAALPPFLSLDDNAAPLYQRAFAALAADASLRGEDSPVADPLAAAVGTPALAATLAGHSDTLDLLRRAADRPGCRFDRDWSQPAIDMLLPEVQEMRTAARLLALAARQAAADGEAAAAVADILRIHRLGAHAASEPILISGLVGQAIDTLAIETLVDVLPRLDKGDLPLLDTDAVRDFVATPINYRRAFLGEEAFGLATLADLADRRTGEGTLDGVRMLSGGKPISSVIDPPLSLLYRCFLLPADIAGYRAVLGRYQAIVADQAGPAPKPAPEVASAAAEIERDLTSRPAGMFSAVITPTLTAVLESWSKGMALHEAAGVVVAATRGRLEGRPLANSLGPDGQLPLPPDPFTRGKPLQARLVDGGWLVYSVGPDGEDDGGPAAEGTESEVGNDDVGLLLRFAPGLQGGEP
jgi:hypothetical protein